MDLGLKESVIAVTGGASGIGAAITRALVAEGARVVVLSRLSRGVPEFFAEMKAAQAPCEWMELDLEDAVQTAEAVRQIEQTYGQLDGLVNNAATNDVVGLEHGDLERFSASLRRNLLHAYVLAHEAVPMLKRSRGSIVNVASKVAVTGQGNTSGYAAAKGALLALTREWAVELAPYGVRVNAVIPSEVMTPAYEAWIAQVPDPAAAVRRIASQVPLGERMTRPEEIASAVVFLLSPAQSSHTTGQHLFVDGGYVHLDRMLTASRQA